MKKILAIVMALLMLCGIALAEENDEAQAAPESVAILPEEFPEAGLTLHLPEEFRHTQGLLTPMGGMEIKPGVTFTMLNYLGMRQEDILALQSEEDPEALAGVLGEALAPLCLVIGLNGDQDMAAFVESMGGALDEGDVRELARAGDMTFYSIDVSGNATALEPGFQEEYEALSALMDDVLANADYYEPINIYSATENATLSFETTDMNGDPVSSAELFGRHEYTLVNIWAS